MITQDELVQELENAFAQNDLIKINKINELEPSFKVSLEIKRDRIMPEDDSAFFPQTLSSYYQVTRTLIFIWNGFTERRQSVNMEYVGGR